VFTRIKREDIDLDTEVACSRRAPGRSPVYSRSYFVPLPGGLGLEVMDVCCRCCGRPHVGFMAGHARARRRAAGIRARPTCCAATSCRSSRATARGSRASG
jgi:hypothetical protein